MSRRSGFQQAHAGPVAAGRAYPEIVALPDEGDAVAQAGGDVPVDAVVGEVGPPAEKPARAGSGTWRVRDAAGARWGGAPHSRRGEGEANDSGCLDSPSLSAGHRPGSGGLWGEAHHSMETGPLVVSKLTLFKVCQRVSQWKLSEIADQNATGSSRDWR